MPRHEIKVKREDGALLATVTFNEEGQGLGKLGPIVVDDEDLEREILALIFDNSANVTTLGGHRPLDISDDYLGIVTALDTLRDDHPGVVIEAPVVRVVATDDFRNGPVVF
jgi:hypothetical protein